ncbi:hypothetical protein EC973_002220 [Apophysomyces ossiformis]|uniref:MACPF domain-containing protein n=1 Tax=Apophysomyces ossiformis TaxID=679940 RepID=A0A8H7BXX0_9FUNG|nr:hypothetical protein EC973_002220 [Apophysomyces ossiformis]
MEQLHAPSEEDIALPSFHNLSEWFHGIHVDGSLAKKQAVEIDPDFHPYIYPSRVLKVLNEHLEWHKPIAAHTCKFRRTTIPLPGAEGYGILAKKAVKEMRGNAADMGDNRQLCIPRRHVFFSPSAFRATEEFEDAIELALQAGSDREKFSELQKGNGLFADIVKGGSFCYRADDRWEGSPKEVIRRAIDLRIPWKAYGGNPDLLLGEHPNIDGWLHSTAHHQVLALPADVKPLYSLLEDNISSEVRRVYKACYDEDAPLYKRPLQTSSNETGALVALVKKQVKIGATKGLFFDGSLSSEDAVEWLNEIHIPHLLKLASSGGKPRIDYVDRRTSLLADAYTHAFLPTQFVDGSESQSSFMKAAMNHYIELNRVKLQSKIPDERYLVMYVTYRELLFDRKYIKATESLTRAVDKALHMDTESEKYNELVKVFDRFGYYYPSSVSLGGRIMYRIKSCDSLDWSSCDDKMDKLDSILLNRDYADAINIIGGNATITRCQEWVESVKTNQNRIYFNSVRPMYEVLEEDQREQVLRIYDHYLGSVDYFPELPKAMHFDGMEAEKQAIEFVGDTGRAKMIMFRNLSDRPELYHVKQHEKTFEDIRLYSLLDIETAKDLPGNLGFVLGSQGVSRERSVTRTNGYPGRKYSYDLAYISYKELYLNDQFIQPTAEFKQAISNALKVGKLDHDTYFALQDVFQQFGYYYASQIEIGGQMILQAPLKRQTTDQTRKEMNMKKRYQRYIDMCWKPGITEVSQVEEEKEKSKDKNQESTGPGNNGALMKYELGLSKQVSTVALQNSIAKSEQIIAVGGNSTCLLWNDVRGWLDTVKANQVVTHRRQLKPLYELLEKDQRRKVQSVYNKVFLADDRVLYNYPLKLSTSGKSTQSEEDTESQKLCVPTKVLYEKLLNQKFSDSSSAVEFCRRACAECGFSVREQKVTEKLICIYCSYKCVSEDAQSNADREKEKANLCQWGVVLAEDEQIWRFQMFSSEEESLHNHELKALDGSAMLPLSNALQAEPINTSTKTQDVAFVTLRPATESTDQASKLVQHLRYGDLVYVQLINSYQSATVSKSSEEDYASSAKATKDFIDSTYFRLAIESFINWHASASKCMEESISEQHVPEHVQMKDAIEGSDLDFLWLVCQLVERSANLTYRKVMPYPSNDETNVQNRCDYVRRGDTILFESQAFLEGSKRIYLSYCSNKFSCVVANNVAELSSMEGGWRVIQNMHQGTNEKLPKSGVCVQLIKELMAAGYMKEGDKKVEKQLHDYHSDSDDDSDNDKAAILGFPSVDGKAVRSLSDLEHLKRKIEELQQAVNQGSRPDYCRLAKLLWTVGEYERALNVYEDATMLFITEAYRELGNLYHTGFSANGFVIAQNRELAFIFYSIGGVFGDGQSALKAAEYYEKGYSKDVTIDYDKALQWYNYVYVQFHIPSAGLAAGKIQHNLARMARNSMETDDRYRRAFEMFSKVEKSEPYAKFMISMYYLTGRGVKQSDTGLGFQMLLELVESGVKDVLPMIVKCYTEGIGVDRDIEKAIAYDELADEMNAE